MGTDNETPQVLPATIGDALGLELKSLGPDDRVRLQQILWQLRGEDMRGSVDLSVATARVQALALSGQANEAREAARRSEDLRRSLGARAPLYLHLNVIFGLVNAGLAELAIASLMDIDRSLLAAHVDRYVTLGIWFTLRFGFKFPETHGKPPLIRFLQENSLYERWADLIQRVVNPVLGEHVALLAPLMDTLDGEEHLFMTYHTDIMSNAELDVLDAELWLRLTEFCSEMPGGVAAFTRRLVFGIRGPMIPLEDLE